MAKKIRFSLEMEQGRQVRSIEELRENFSLVRVLFYMSNGKLMTWLKDRYANDIAESLEKLDTKDTDFYRKICKIFDVEYNEQAIIELEKVEERNRKLRILEEHTIENRFLEVVDLVAFTEDDLYDLLNEGATMIYLCGKKFSIPLSKKGITYIGINNPTVAIDSKEEVDWKEKNISLRNVNYDINYQKLLEESNNRHRNSNSFIGEYKENTYISFLLSKQDKSYAKQCYNSLAKKILKINYEVDADTLKLMKKLKTSHLIGLADTYLERL